MSEITENPKELPPIPPVGKPREIAKPSEDYRIKLIGYRWDFLKFFLGTVVLGVATAISTYIFRSFELKIESRKTEGTYLQAYSKQFLEITKSGEYTRGIDMADFLRLSAIDQDLKTAWTDVRNYFKHKLDSLENLNKDVQKEDTKNISQKIGEKHIKIETLSQKFKDDKSYTRAQFIEDSAHIIAQAKQAEKKLQSIIEKKNEVSASLEIARSKTSSEEKPLENIESRYEIVYDEDRYVGKGYFNEIIDDITVSYMKKTNGVLLLSVGTDKVNIDFKQSTTFVKSFTTGHRVTIDLIAIQNMSINFLNKEISYHIKVEKLKNLK